MAAIKKSEACVECQEQPPRVRKGKRFKLCEDCRRSVTTRRWHVRKALRSLRNEIGHVVEFNEGEGWRAGYLVETLSVNARVQPIGSCGRIPDIITVCIADVKTPTCGSPSMPTIEDFYKRMETMKPRRVLVASAPFVSHKADVLAPVDEKNELAPPEVGDVSFPFGANVPVQEKPVFTEREQTKKLNSGVIQPSVSIATCKALAEKTPKKPKADAIIAGSQYGSWKTVEYAGHSRWKCVSDSGETKVIYSSELRTAAATK
jgi:hypothetical protein